uniref:Uncharacterized protein n=1 Tax=Physcomitrium patens TaxID=3218 RepID=A0A2K1IPA6_PHYPA|nr:hypothetical protein PHYPA_027429 [Physcomitrium patens]
MRNMLETCHDGNGEKLPKDPIREGLNTQVAHISCRSRDSTISLRVRKEALMCRSGKSSTILFVRCGIPTAEDEVLVVVVAAQQVLASKVPEVGRAVRGHKDAWTSTQPATSVPGFRFALV